MITSKQILIEARTKKFKDERVGVLVDALKDKNREINKLKEELDNYAYLLESKEKDLSKYKSYVA